MGINVGRIATIIKGKINTKLQDGSENFGRIATIIKGKINTKLQERSERLQLEKLEDDEYKGALAKARKDERMRAVPIIAKAQVGMETSNIIAGFRSGKSAKKETSLWGKAQNASANFSAGITKDMNMFGGGFGMQQPTTAKGRKKAVKQANMFGGFSAPTMDFKIPQMGFGESNRKKRR